MKTNNRPMVKVVEFEVIYYPPSYPLVPATIKWKERNFRGGQISGKTREVERPMNDTEYIEHLEIKLQVLKELSLNDKESTSYFKIEGGGVVYTQRYVETQWKENQELKDQLRDRDFSDKNYQAYLKLETEYQCLLANNNELKVTLMNTALKDISRIAEIQDQFLKVVESVIKEFYLVPVKDTYEEYCTMKNPYWSYYGSLDSFNKLMEHILQEIKSVIEKGKE